MRRVLLFAVLLLTLAIPAQAAITFVTGRCDGSSDGVTLTTTAINSTGGDLIVIGVSGGSGVDQAPSDSKSNAITALGFQDVGGGERLALYYIKGSGISVGAGHTFSANIGTGNLPTICIAVFSGAHTTAPFDQENGHDDCCTTSTTGSVTPSEGNEVVVTGIAFNVTGTMTINSSFTIPANGQVNPDANHEGGAIAYLIQTSASATSPTWTSGGAGTSMAARIATFKSSGGGGGGATAPVRWMLFGVGP